MNDQLPARAKGMKQVPFAVFAISFVMMGIIVPGTDFFGVQTPAPEFTWNGEPFRPVGVNYYPRDHPWTGTWTAFNLTELQEDFERIKALGGNCVRTFIQWELVETGPGVYNLTIVDRIVAFFNAASEANIAVMFSFFDFGPPAWTGYKDQQDQMYVNEGLIALEIAQLQYLIPLVNETSAAFLWDLRNEPTSSTISQDQFTLWVANLTATIRDLGDTHYVAVGGGWGNFEDPAMYTSLDVDAVCMHFYASRDKPTWKRDFEKYAAKFTATGKPVILQEFGWPTWTEGNGITEAMQASYYGGIFDASDRAGVDGIMAWCLWDYPMNLDWKGTGDHSEEHFGLLRLDGSWKTSAHAFYDYATGTRARTWNFDLGGRF